AVELREDLVNGADVALVEGEALSQVVAGSAQPLQLINDRVAVLVAPFPDLLLELGPADLLPARSLVCELLLHDRLRGDPRMVRAEYPDRVPPPHPVEANQDVLDRPVERVTHVERTGDVRGRDRDREVLAGRALGRRMEPAPRHPTLEDALLDRVRIPARRRLERLPAFRVHAGDLNCGVRARSASASPASCISFVSLRSTSGTSLSPPPADRSPWRSRVAPLEGSGRR